MSQGHAQNLVINPGFETYNKEAFSKTCKFIFIDSINVDGWSSCGKEALGSWHKCSSESMFLSHKQLGVKPHGGKWMIGFTVIRHPKGNNQREYIIGRSVKPLTAGLTYRLTFFLSPRDGCVQGVKELGILFGNSIIPSSDYNFSFTETPQLIFSTEDITQKGEFELGGRKVDLKNMTLPFLNIFATEDTIIPNSSTTPVMKVIGSKDKEEYAFPGGHIGVFVGAKSQKELAPKVASWVASKS